MRKVVRLVCTMVSIALMLSFSVTVFAENIKTYELSELSLSISVPTRCVVYTRELCEDENLLMEKGFTKSSLVSHFVSDNIYFNALDTFDNQEIVVTMMDGTVTDFNLLGESTLNMLAETLIDQYDSYGIVVNKYDIYQHAQAKFIRIFIKDNNSSVFGLQYYTTYDSKAINFTLRSYSGSITSEKESLIRSIVDSVKFNSEPQKSTSSEMTTSFQYKDEEAGVRFNVPVNWVEKQMTKPRQFLDVMFVSAVDEGSAILYGSKDIWAQMTASEKRGYSRQDISSDIFTKSEISEMMDCSVTDVTEVTYGNTPYYQIITTNQNVSGTGFTITMTAMVNINNGWLFEFQFFGRPDHKLFPEFESLLNSVSYANAITTTQNSTIPTKTTQKEVNSNNSDNKTAGIVIIALIAAVIIIFIIIWQKKKNVSKSNPYEHHCTG